MRPPIRTNNPGGLAVAFWQRNFPGFVGAAPADASGHAMSIYTTPEHGIAAWYHMLTNRYGFGEDGTVQIGELARWHASGHDQHAQGPADCVASWRRWSGDRLDQDSTIDLADPRQLLLLARAMFCHEIDGPTPLSDVQIAAAVAMKRNGTLPPA